MNYKMNLSRLMTEIEISAILFSMQLKQFGPPGKSSSLFCVLQEGGACGDGI